MVNQNNAGQGNVQHDPNPYINRIVDFHWLRPPKFGGSDNPIEADDWLHEIEMKLDVVHANDRDKVLLTIQQLVGPALAWWHSYKEVNPDARNIVWNDFVRLFHEHHILNSVVKLKWQEFMSLQQRNLSVTEYVHKFTELFHYVEEKHDSFLCGLDPELRTVIGARVYHEFNTMVNKSITIVKNK
jgi:hypothetical protein